MQKIDVLPVIEVTESEQITDPGCEIRNSAGRQKGKAILRWAQVGL